jgi:hypothetical protein
VNCCQDEESAVFHIAAGRFIAIGPQQNVGLLSRGFEFQVTRD